MHDDWLALSGMKDCFIGLHSGGDWLAFGATIVSSLTLSLGLCRMVHSISVSSGRMVGFLDLSPCMNQTKFGSYSSFSTAVLMSLELHSIAEGCVLDRTWPAFDCNHRNYTTANLEQRQNRKQLFFFFQNKNRIEIKQNSSKIKLKQKKKLKIK
jgi:hypothetical protein